MHLKGRAIMAAVSMLAIVLAGCLDAEPTTSDVEVTAEPLDLVFTTVEETMTFTESVVDAALSYTNDLYEPTMEVSDNGVIYITGHTILVDTTGAPVFASYDDGQTWEQLPFFMDAQMPADMHGATPPPSDEIFLVSGDDGWLYGVDITLATFPVNAWSDDGRMHAYHNPDAYDEVQGMETRTGAGDCFSLSLNDRPWAAYANGTLFMVNNPGGGPVQIGVMDAPMDLPVGGPATVPGGAEWNLCASSGGWIPGIPDLREDGFFAVPQVQGEQLVLVTGNTEDIYTVTETVLFDFVPGGTITSQYGQAVFDAEGTLFVGIQDNQEEKNDAREGRVTVAVSEDGVNFNHVDFVMEGQVTSMYMDGNFAGPGALLTWVVLDEDGNHDHYVGHLFIENGFPVLKNVALAIDDGPRPSAHVTGAAIGPDGRAYLAAFDRPAGTNGVLSTPLSVFIQEDGVAMPVTIVDELVE